MKKTFKDERTFGAYNAAETWLRSRGYSYGSMSAPHPTGIMRGDVLIAKWKNLTAVERAQCDGTITGDFRDGPVVVEIEGEPS